MLIPILSRVAIIAFVLLKLLPTAKSVNECGCSRNFKPVCGSDEETYENLCKLTCEQRLRPALKLAYSGTCCPRAEFCTTFSDPLCDNLGETHENECIFSYKQCVAKRSHNLALKIERRGPCNSKSSSNNNNERPPPLDCNFFCDESEELVCDNMGHTHKNLCKFELAKCRRISRGLEAPEITKTGECGSFRGSNVRRTQTSVGVTTQPSVALKARAWNYGTFAPPPPIPIIEATSSPLDIDSYGFGSAVVSTPETTIKLTTEKTSFPSSITTQMFSTQTQTGTFPPSVQPVSTYSSITPVNTFPMPANELSSTPSEPSLFKNCITCESEIDQVAICDNLNETHQSICTFARWNCKRRMSGLEERVLVHVGNCSSESPTFSMEEEVCPSKCSKHYKPVCDTNGMTHPNLCTFQMFNCQQRKTGNINVAWLQFLQECPPTTTAVPSPSTSKSNNAFDCPRPQCPNEGNENSMICDNEGNTHINECEFAHARCLAAKRGVVLRLLPEEMCTRDSICYNATIEVCSSEIDPICATDFVTYPNMCHFRKAQCKSEEEIEILFKDECKRCLNTPCPIVDPSNASLDDSIFLCDQNGETKSKCEFEMLRCIYEVKFGYNITEAYDGRCCPRNELCPMEHQTICGSNGQNYRNKCYFDVAKCRAEKIEHDFLSTVDCPTSIKMLDSGHNCERAACTTEYDPVCGSDGKTYTNLCNFHQKTCNNKNGPILQIEYRGSCCEEKCSAVDYSPVCDSQNITHLNICEFGKERCLATRKENHTEMMIVSYKACEKVPCNTECPAIYEPVCGSNGETFSSECELARAVCILNNAGETSLSIDYPGVCCQKESCELSFEPICDSQGRSHVNECVFRQEACLSEKKNGLNITIEHKGECCNKVCDNNSTNQQPVCDTSGRTHANLCEFQSQKCEAERVGVSLNVAYTGECCALPFEMCANSTAVCDSDGMSHKNMCEYEYKKCVISKTQPKLLSIVHAGHCCLLDKCVDENKPVCDSRGVTHLSLCHFNNSKCVYEKVHGTDDGSLSLAYKSKCCEKDCSDILQPVCDQHGDVYRNKCIFEHHVCEVEKREPDKEKLYLSPCKKRVKAR